MVRIDDSEDTTKCWLDQKEIEALAKAAGQWDWQREIAIQLMGRCGFRVSEVPYPGDKQLRYSDEGDCWFVEVVGKDTSGGEKKTRDCWMPDEVAENIHRYARERELESLDSWVTASVPSVRRWVREAAQSRAEDTENQRWLEVSSHDLRRSWATYHLVERDVDVRTMMSIGGWSDYQSIEPYLAEPTESKIGQSMRSV